MSPNLAQVSIIIVMPFKVSPTKDWTILFYYINYNFISVGGARKLGKEISPFRRGCLKSKTRTPTILYVYTTSNIQYGEAKIAIFIT